MTFEVFGEGLAFPEGPVAMADGSVILVELAAGLITRVAPGGAKTTISRPGGGPNGLALGPDGKLYCCNNGGKFNVVKTDEGYVIRGIKPDHVQGSIQRIDIATGKVETLYEACDGDPLWSPNDLVFDRSGGFWFTDNGRNDGKTLSLGGLYYAKADGSKITRIQGGMISPNGVGLSPDESAVYVADNTLFRMWSFALGGPGILAQPNAARRGAIVANLDGFQGLDSLKVEANGLICGANFGKGGVTVFRPQGGVEGFVPITDGMTTNLVFGGSDMRDVWVTASRIGQLLKGRWPRPGLKLNFSR